MRSEPTAVLQAVPFHFLLKFPPEYPNSPPELRLFQPIPHPNVKPVTGGIQVLHAATPANPNSSGSRRIPVQARWRLSLWDCIPGKDSWSSGYSVHSVLLQLQGESPGFVHDLAALCFTIAAVIAGQQVLCYQSAYDPAACSAKALPCCLRCLFSTHL